MTQPLDVERWNEAVGIIDDENSVALARRIEREEARMAEAGSRVSEHNRRLAIGEAQVRTLRTLADRYGSTTTVADTLPELHDAFREHEATPQQDRPWNVWRPIELDDGVNLYHEGGGSIRAAVSPEHCFPVERIGPLIRTWTWAQAVEEHERIADDAERALNQAEREYESAETNLTAFKAVLDEYDAQGAVMKKPGAGGIAADLTPEQRKIVKALDDVCKAGRATSQSKAADLAAEEVGTTPYRVKKTAERIGAWQEGKRPGTITGPTYGGATKGTPAANKGRTSRAGDFVVPINAKSHAKQLLP